MTAKLVVANWKMHGSIASSKQLIDTLKQLVDASKKNIAVCPPSPYLQLVKNELGEDIQLGAQDLSVMSASSGAYTGEVSGAMLNDIGCHFVIVGHSERRSYFKETEVVLCGKLAHAIANDLTPIFCIGEPLEVRESGNEFDYVKTQLDQIIDQLGVSIFDHLVLAYEPIWAIGTGKTATPDEAQKMHKFIREHLKARGYETAQRTKILYGGSVNEKNAVALFSQNDIDGALVGGASLDGDKFSQICLAAENI